MGSICKETGKTHTQEQQYPSSQTYKVRMDLTSSVKLYRLK